MLHVRHALWDNTVPSSAKQHRELMIFAGLMTTGAFIIKSSLHFLYILQRRSLQSAFSVLRQRCVI